MYSDYSYSSALTSVDAKMCTVDKNDSITAQLYSPINSTNFLTSEIIDCDNSSQHQCSHANDLLHSAKIETRKTESMNSNKKYHRCALIRLYQRLQEPELNQRIDDRVESFLDWIQSKFEGLSSWRIRSVLTEVTHLPSKERCAICLEDCISEAMESTITPSSNTKNDHEKGNDSNNNNNSGGTTNNSLPSIAKKTTGKDKEPSKRSHRIIAKSNDKTNNTNTTNTTNSNNVTNGSVRLSSNTTHDEKRNENENTTENSSSSPSSDSTKCVQIISCGHVFHKHCIKSWLRVKDICPVCKVAASKKRMPDERASVKL